MSGNTKIREVRIAGGITQLASTYLNSVRKLQYASISANVVTPSNWFSSCYSLSSATLPKRLTGISANMFYYCYALKSITIPISVTSIGNYAFQYCYSLQSVTIPSSVTSIGDSAFSSCYSLQSVTIPSSVTSIGKSAFGSCTWLKTITVLATTPPTLGNTAAIPSTYVTTIYIPNGTLSAYQGATNWSSFSSKFVELPA